MLSATSRVPLYLPPLPPLLTSFIHHSLAHLTLVFTLLDELTLELWGDGEDASCEVEFLRTHRDTLRKRDIREHCEENLNSAEWEGFFALTFKEQN